MRGNVQDCTVRVNGSYLVPRAASVGPQLPQLPTGQRKVHAAGRRAVGEVAVDADVTRGARPVSTATDLEPEPRRALVLGDAAHEVLVADRVARAVGLLPQPPLDGRQRRGRAQRARRGRLVTQPASLVVVAPRCGRGHAHPRHVGAVLGLQRLEVVADGRRGVVDRLHRRRHQVVEPAEEPRVERRDAVGQRAHDRRARAAGAGDVERHELEAAAIDDALEVVPRRARVGPGVRSAHDRRGLDVAQHVVGRRASLRVPALRVGAGAARGRAQVLVHAEERAEHDGGDRRLEHRRREPRRARRVVVDALGPARLEVVHGRPQVAEAAAAGAHAAARGAHHGVVAARGVGPALGRMQRHGERGAGGGARGVCVRRCAARVHPFGRVGVPLEPLPPAQQQGANVSMKVACWEMRRNVQGCTVRVNGSYHASPGARPGSRDQPPAGSGASSSRRADVIGGGGGGGEGLGGEGGAGGGSGGGDGAGNP